MTQNKFPKRLALAVVIAAVLIGAVWSWRSKASNAETRKSGPPPVLVVTTQAAQSVVQVKLSATGTVTPVQQVDIRPQVTSTVARIHIKEGQQVRHGELLFSLDARADEANIRKADAQLAKSRSDLATAQRNLDRQRELFKQKFISQAALDQAQNEFDVVKAQLAVDEAGVEASRVTRGYQEIRAPFAGRTGAVQAFPGTLVQPNSAALVSITQLDPINVSFTLPERELPALQAALSRGDMPVTALIADGKAGSVAGKLSFLDNAVDTATGTIRLKAQFSNAGGKLWPGMFVTVSLAPRSLDDAIIVPAQAVQTGPERKFVYVADAENKVASKPVQLLNIQDGLAAITGIKAGDRVVVEGAQNLRPGSTIAERKKEDAKPGKGDAPAAAVKAKGP
ncbi:MAG: efflux RND transporter periplasmic adaptor subunit [Betaproteobacteria bacterium]|nr:efflux RND transporter periplasmic adaptor subunit [Betaproteobacteria bacterium]